MTADDGTGARHDGGRPLKVAYILHRFPYLTETFIVREMHHVRRLGVELTIFSLMRPHHAVISRDAQALVPLCHYRPALSWEVLKAQWHFLRRNPMRYLRAYGRVVRQTYREPKVLFLMTALFPKAVSFAHDISLSGIDHVHAHFAWIEGIAAGVVRDLTGVTFTIHPHAFGLFGRDRRDVQRELESASRVVTISEYHRAFIARLSPRIAPEDIEVVHCGIEPERFKATERPADRSPLRILSVGRAIEKKGHRYLIDACRRMADAGLDFRCDIVAGDGQDSADLQAQIDRLGLGATVRLLASRDDDGILQLLEQADIFALACVVARSGDRDGIPVSLMEAMASQLPVVSTSVSGVPELVEDGVTGLLVPERDSEALADALQRLLGDAALRQRLGRQGRDRVVADFHVAEGAARMVSIFRSVSGERVV